MAKVTFIGTTVTSKGIFRKGESSNLFTDEEAKDLQRLSTVESPEAPTVKEEPKKKRSRKKKVEKDELQESTEK